MPVDAALADEVTRLVIEVGRTEIAPRFGRLAPGDIREKAPGDIVTVADRAAEEALTRRLVTVLPGSVVVGEELVADDPSALELLHGDAPVWVLDPIDGTENFAAGSARFATLVALVEGGRATASWTHAPVLGWTATALAGGGAWEAGERLRVGEGTALGSAQGSAQGSVDGSGGPSGPDRRRDRRLDHLDVMVPQRHWWTPAVRAGVDGLAAAGCALSHFDTSGLTYLELAAGRRGVLVLTWELVWDHVAGLLLHEEAGGVARTLDGRPFDVHGGNALPLIAGPDESTVAAVAAAWRGQG